MLRNYIKIIFSAFGFFFLTACATTGIVPTEELSDAKINPETVTGHALRWVPAPPRSIPVAVYGIADETGAFKPSEGGQTLSRALTQAPTPLLIKALHDAGNRKWFNVIERENLSNLIKERQIISEMRQRYLGETSINKDALPALKFAGILIEGAITGYDTNMRTGGVGARYLGVGAFTQYREDSVSVYLRAVSVKTGEVLLSITSEQRVASVALQGDIFRFVAFQKLLEAEAGLTFNQPRHLAVRQALEKAVYGLIVEGAEIGLWQFEDQEAGVAAINHYRENYAPLEFANEDARLPAEFYESHRRLAQRGQNFAMQAPPRPQPQAQPVRRVVQAAPKLQETVPPVATKPAPAPVVEGNLKKSVKPAPPKEAPSEPEARKVAKVEPSSAPQKVAVTRVVKAPPVRKEVAVAPPVARVETSAPVARVDANAAAALSEDLQNVAGEIEVARLNTKQRYALGAVTAPPASQPPVVTEASDEVLVAAKETEIQTTEAIRVAEELGLVQNVISTLSKGLADAVSTNLIFNAKGQ